MRRFVLWFQTAVFLAPALVGCSKSSTTDSGPGSDFGLRLAWPAPPEESRTPATLSGGEIQTYMAHHISKAPGRFLMYSANVTDFGTAPGNRMGPRERLTAFKFAFRNEEVSRKEFEHGPKKYPGLDIVTRFGIGEKVRRELVVADRNRVYLVSVTASTAELFQAPEVTSFFDSFSVED
jgi:hypothetical protein